MRSRTMDAVLRSVFVVCLAMHPVLCHMEMSWPYALRSKFNPDTPREMIDYSMTSPLDANGSDFPCKGYHNDVIKPLSTVYSAGSSYNLTLSGSVVHGGGSCQISLSYDNGTSFKVIKSLIGGCPLTSTYNFTIPRDAPRGHPLLAWSWQNKLGNREFYMNCAAVEIVSGRQVRRWASDEDCLSLTLRSVRYSQSNTTDISSLPNLWIAIIHSINACKTVEGEQPIYPHAGPEVEYGDGFGIGSEPTPGECDGPRA